MNLVDDKEVHVGKKAFQTIIAYTHKNKIKSIFYKGNWGRHTTGTHRIFGYRPTALQWRVKSELYPFSPAILSFESLKGVLIKDGKENQKAVI